MNVVKLSLDGLCLIELKIFRDERGFFVERYNQRDFVEHGLEIRFVQDNHSRSAPGVLRGFHYQTNPPQGKLVGVVRGRIWDVAVDVRKGSPTFGHHYSVELNDKNGQLLWIPSGFAHGFCVLGDEPADVLYKVDALYNPAAERGIHWADPNLKIQWPIAAPLVSERDNQLPAFK